MICQATYDSLDAIPDVTVGEARLRDEFEQVNGKWQLKDSAIPGVGPLFNSALAANERKAVDQVKARNAKIAALEQENTSLKDKLDVLDSPDHKVLSKEDSELFDRYVKIGTPKELEKVKSEHTEMSQKVKAAETKEAMAEIAEVGGINGDVLADWATNAGEGISFLVKSVEQTDAKGNKTTVKVPYVSVTTKEGNKTSVTEKELLPFAKETLPEWKYAALTTVAGKAPDKVKPTVTAPVTQGGVRLPDLGKASSDAPSTQGEERPVDKFNKQRESRPSPFAKNNVAGIPITNAGGAIGQVK